MLQKSLTKEAEKSKNVNARSSPSHAPQPAEVHQTDVSNAPVDLSGHAAMTGPQAGDDEGSSESSDDSDGTPLAARKMKPPRPISPSADAELDEIIHGPVRPRLTIDDINFDEEEEPTENVVLENDDDDHDDRKLRRLSRKMTTPGSSDDENDEDEDDEVNESANALTFSPAPPPVRPPSNEPSLSVDISLTGINARPSVEMDLDGDIAVNKALASDNAVLDLAKSFPSGEGEIEGINPDPSSPAGSRVSSTPPREESDTERREIVNSRVSPPRTPRHAKTAPVADDPIEPAEGFSPTPVRRRNPVVPTTPSTPQRRIAQMKDRNGKLSARFAELDPSRLAAQSERSAGGPEVEVPPLSMPAKEQAISQPTRRTTRASSLAAIPPPPPLSEVNGKRKRGPNKTPEQRLQEAAAKAEAKQEKERVRKETTLAKAAAKTKPKTTSIQDSDCPPSTQDLAEPKKPTRRSPNKEKHSLTPQNTWTTLPHPSTSPGGEEDGRDRDSMCDELNPSSPDVTADRERANPLFLHAESQLAFPYSQWNNSIPEEDPPGFPKASDDEEEEDEVEASVQSSQPLKNATTASYRRLTDIASQPSLFSVSPALRAADFPSATFPRAKDKRADLYWTAPIEEDDSSDSDSSAADLPSHIPKSRRAGMVRQSKIGT
ncbi:hypothetical protein C8J57DRAFT_596052 [Mycena rebaudengoi]|nr:hypothetical protein C8J57DRAFT_596052 [Mycena rebaudengoi]